MYVTYLTAPPTPDDSLFHCFCVLIFQFKSVAEVYNELVKILKVHPTIFTFSKCKIAAIHFYDKLNPLYIHFQIHVAFFVSRLELP